MSCSMEGEEVQYYEDGKVKRGIIRNGVFMSLDRISQKKGTSNMAKKQMTKQAMALMKWRAEHMDKDGKVVVPRRSPDVILNELKKKRELYAERMAMVEKKIRYYDMRLNADRRKALLAQLTTEQLEAIVKRLTNG